MVTSVPVVPMATVVMTAVVSVVAATVMAVVIEVVVVMEQIAEPAPGVVDAAPNRSAMVVMVRSGCGRRTIGNADRSDRQNGSSKCRDNETSH